MEKIILCVAIIITIVIIPLTGYYYTTKSNENLDKTDIRQLEKIDKNDNFDANEYIVTQKIIKNEKTKMGKILLNKVAEFSVSGRIVAITKHGSFNDLLKGEDAMPVDIGIAWGDFATKVPSEIRFKHSLPTLDFSSKNKWLFWEGITDLKTAEKLKHHVANIHIVPESKDILAAIQDLKNNELVKLTGFLVDIQIDNKVYKSSTSRSDTGAGACEILYVTSVEMLN